MSEAIFAALAVAFAAFAVWLTVRIVNRKERWAKWTAAVLAVALIVYPVSAGPWCYAMGRYGAESPFIDATYSIYVPLQTAVSFAPDCVSDAFHGYCRWWDQRGIQSRF
jgi:hypothetical protein